MRRTILLSVVLLVGCSDYFQKQVANPCPGGGGGNVPIACIDASLHATPNPVHAKRGQWVHFFFTRGTDDLDIQLDVLENKNHDHGHAWGKVRGDASFGSHKYTVVDLTTGKTYDPEVMIDP